MIPISGMKSARPADIEGGHLVLCKWEHKFQPALAVSIPPHRGVLLLIGGKPPEFALSNSHCLDLGKPIFQCDFHERSVSDATLPLPDVGHLIAYPNGTLITGIGIRDLRQTRCAWDLNTGEIVDIDLATTIHFNKWTLGMKDASGQFQQLFTFEPLARS